MREQVLPLPLAGQLDVLWVANKVDLVGAETGRNAADRFADEFAGDVLCISATTGEGVGELRQLLDDRWQKVDNILLELCLFLFYEL